MRDSPPRREYVRTSARRVMPSCRRSPTVIALCAAGVRWDAATARCWWPATKVPRRTTVRCVSPYRGCTLLRTCSWSVSFRTFPTNGPISSPIFRTSSGGASAMRGADTRGTFRLSPLRALSAGRPRCGVGSGRPGCPCRWESSSPTGTCLRRWPGRRNGCCAGASPMPSRIRPIRYPSSGSMRRSWTKG